MLALVLAAAGAVGPPWEVVPEGRSVNGLEWYAVVCDGVRHASYSCPEVAAEVAGELRRRKFGPFWYRGRDATWAVRTGGEIFETAVGRVADRKRRN